MKIILVSHPNADGEILAAYSDKRAQDAERLAKQIGGFTIGPVLLNRDIPSDAKQMFVVELTKDGAIRAADEFNVFGVLYAKLLLPGWEVWETSRRWRLKVRLWAKNRASAEAEAKAIFADIVAGRRAKSGSL